MHSSQKQTTTNTVHTTYKVRCTLASCGHSYVGYVQSVIIVFCLRNSFYEIISWSVTSIFYMKNTFFLSETSLKQIRKKTIKVSRHDTYVSLVCFCVKKNVTIKINKYCVGVSIRLVMCTTMVVWRYDSDPTSNNFFFTFVRVLFSKGSQTVHYGLLGLRGPTILF